MSREYGPNPKYDVEEDFYDDLEDDDDIFSRPRAKSPKTEAVGGVEDEAPKKIRYTQLPLSLRVGIIVALIIGIIGGVYVGSQSLGGGEQYPDGHPDVSQMGSGQQTGPSVEGLAELVAAVELDPTDVEARLALGVQYFNSRNLDGAAEQWREVIELDPENVAAWYNMGYFYMSQEPVDEAGALEAWARVIELDPESTEAMAISQHMTELESEKASTESVDGN